MKLKNLKINSGQVVEGETLREVQQLYRLLDNARAKKIQEFIETSQPTPVYHIVHALRLEQCVVSQFLARFRAFDLMKTRRNGKEVLYSINRVTFEDVKEFRNVVPAKQIHALCNDLRIDILQLLIDSKQRISVTDIYTRLRIEKSVASNQLSILYGADLVDFEKDGKNHLYFPIYSQLEKVYSELENFKISV